MTFLEKFFSGDGFMPHGHRAEAAISELQSQQALILDSISEGIHWIDKDGLIGFGNPAAARMLGWDAIELIGQPAHATIHHTRADGTPYPRNECPICTGLSNGQRCSGVNEVFWRKDGTSFPVEYTSSPARDAAGGIAGCVVVFSDVSEREQSAKALAALSERTAQRERLLTTMLSFISDFTYIFDREGRFLFMNQPLLDLWGLTLEEAIGRTFLELKYPEDLAAKLADQIQKVFDTGQSVTDETAYTSPSGVPGVYEYIFTPALAEDGTVAFVVGCTRDIAARKKAEAALRESERTQREVARELEVERARLLAAQAAGKIGSWETDLVTLRAFWSAETYSIFGTSQDQFDCSHAEFLTRVHPDDRALVDASFAKSCGQPGSHSLEHRILLADGRTAIVEERWQVLCNEHGQPSRAVGTCQDITERKNCEQAMERTLQRLNDAQRIGQIGDWDWDVTSQAITWSPQVFEIVGRDPLLGPPRDYAENETTYDAPSQALLKERVTLALKTGEPQVYELRGRRPNGDRIDVLGKAMRRRDDSGQVTGLYGTIQDITERKRSEAALRESEEWLRTVFEASRDGLVVEGNGTIRYANTAFARILGYDTPAELVGRRPSEFLPPDEAERLAGYGKARAGGENPPTFYEFKGKRKDGSLVQVEASVSACVITGSHYITTAIRDITDRKLEETEREKINTLLLETSRQAGMAEVATSVLHNVGNVLNSVNVSCSVIGETVRKSRIGTVAKTADLLHEHAGDLPAFFTSDPIGRSLPEFITKLAQRLSEEQALVLAEAHALSQNIEHIREIISVQQDYAKNIAGVRETLAVGGLVEDALRMNSAALIRHRVELIREFTDTPALRLEKHKVLQILVNLIRNAKHALVDSEQTNRQLTVRVGANNGHVAISVSDNGVGISPENLTRVFTHGFTTKAAGHGFGLHNGVLAAQQMGGSLRVQSDGVGCGATFTLELPRVPEGATP